MYSVNTNLGAMAALQSLNSIQSDLSTTQKHISTGKKVSEASDNPAVYSIATKMSDDAAGLSTVSDGLSLGSSVVSAASSAVSQIAGQLQTLKQAVIQYNQGGMDQGKVQTQMQSILANIDSFAKSATINNINLIDGGATAGAGGAGSLNVTLNLQGETLGLSGAGTSSLSAGLSVGTVAAAGTGASTGGLTAVGTANYVDLTSSGLNLSAAAAGDLLDSTGTAGPANLTTINNAIDVVNKVAAALGGASSQISGMQTFTASLENSLTAGVGALTDADMAAESAKLQSLQTRQQLAVQSMSIANQQPQIIMKLFGG